ncbi:hypothetical protein SBA6_450013 [Candidatus Sulfopaludibacter sp. SbA6]|nr:hypothetical protein SBA6_450013 [Candidatus Sulfopaludibacter sp. SbA6]
MRFLAIARLEQQDHATFFNVGCELFQRGNQQPFLNFARIHEWRQVLEAIRPECGHFDQAVRIEGFGQLQAVPIRLDSLGALFGIGIQEPDGTNDGAYRNAHAIELFLKKLQGSPGPFRPEFDAIEPQALHQHRPLTKLRARQWTADAEPDGARSCGGHANRGARQYSPR